MRGQAFCPAHITGFFKAGIDSANPENAGSLGAGFSIRDGVTTTVSVEQRLGLARYDISTEGFDVDNTKVSEFVVERFLELQDFESRFVSIRHEIAVPVGYGLGCSGAVALSLAYALDQALETGLPREEIGRIAHVAEVSCKTGLGDVLASYHGGFEIRTSPGAPGVGRVEKIESSGISAIMICLAPISTTDFLRDRLAEINGLGGRMVDRLMETKSRDQFQDMSLEFAGHVNIMTPRMQKIVDEMHACGIRCGVALFGQTVFALVPDGRMWEVSDVVSSKFAGATIIESKIDQRGARVVQ